jgi:hypothetical protein
MEFRLTYEGSLLATQRDPVTGQVDKRADHKHDIRRQFHLQLKRFWEITPFLKGGERSGPSVLVLEPSPTKYKLTIDELSKAHAHYGWNFIPLVTNELDLICGIDILFLRPDKPGQVVWAGDIDNRLKTLLDSLRVPEANERYDQQTPGPDEKPFLFFWKTTS